MKRRGGDPVDVAAGGLVVYVGEGDGSGERPLLQVLPPDLAGSLRFLVARLQRGEDLSVLQTIAVTSALLGEGVSTVARGLATIIAHDLDRRVCLLEANWWSGDSNDAGEATTGTGLAGVLDGSCSLENALRRTSDARLSVLPAGRLEIGERPFAAASSAFTEVLDSLVKEFDMVVLDVPPVLKASEATSIARRAEATTLVVRQGVTTGEQVTAAVQELDGCEFLGVIMNRSSSHVPRFLRRFVTAG